MGGFQCGNYPWEVTQPGQEPSRTGRKRKRGEERRAGTNFGRKEVEEEEEMKSSEGGKEGGRERKAEGRREGSRRERERNLTNRGSPCV